MVLQENTDNKLCIYCSTLVNELINNLDYLSGTSKWSKLTPDQFIKQQTMERPDGFEDWQKKREAAIIAKPQKHPEEKNNKNHSKAVLEKIKDNLQDVNNHDQKFIITILKSKFFWIAVVVLFLLYTAYTLGVRDTLPWTEEKQKEAIDGCKKWGGEAIYDNNGKYLDCFLNGRLDSLN